MGQISFKLSEEGEIARREVLSLSCTNLHNVAGVVSVARIVTQQWFLETPLARTIVTQNVCVLFLSTCQLTVSIWKILTSQFMVAEPEF